MTHVADAVPSPATTRHQSDRPLLRLALADAGSARLGDILVGDALRERRLVTILTESHINENIAMSAVYTEARRRMPKVKAFLDFLVERFAHAPWKLAT